MTAKSMPTFLSLFALVLLARVAPTRLDAPLAGTESAAIDIEGMGSTTASPLFQAWIDEYHRLHPQIRLSSQAIGSHGGTRQLLAGESSFAATDVPIPDAELALARRQILAFPVALNAIVPIYSLPGNPELRFSESTLGGIFLGKIAEWDDTTIASDNPAVVLPRMDIKVAHHFPSGTVETEIMVDYLSKISAAFRTTLADSSSGANWPVANAMAGFKGPEGMEQFVRETPGSIGYLPLSIARLEPADGDEGKFEYGAVRNSAGEFVTASSESVAAASAAEIPFIESQAPNFRVSITNAPGMKSYPIASFIWLDLYENLRENQKSEATADFLKWILTDGQQLAAKLGYPALPGNLAWVELRRLEAATPKTKTQALR